MKRSHAANVLMPLILLLCFALCATAVLLFGADVYSETVSASAMNDNSRTALAYISEKIHRCDENGAVSVGEFDGCECLVIGQNLNGTACTVYIYEYNNSLMELFAEDGASVSAAFGTEICRISDFSVQELSRGVFRFTCTDTDGMQASAIASVKSKG